MPRFRPLSLPTVPLGQQLTANLIPDPVTPDARALVATATSYPSLLRRARVVRDGAHFSFVTPLPLAFPYEFPPPSNDSVSDAESVERYLRDFEPQRTNPGAAFPPARQHSPPFPSARLMAFSPQAHATCLPHLDVGDTHAWLQQTSGVQKVYSSGPSIESQTSTGPMDSAATGAAEPSHLYGQDRSDTATARQALSDWASGRALRVNIQESEPVNDEHGTGVHFLARHEDDVQNTKQALAALHTRTSYGPWSLRYGGHQFGQWAGQLGDGRTVSILETLHPETGARHEVQLKGAGRTPYSRFGDGLATLKSSVREFLASEYMAALGIPTSYSLCVVSLPDLPVLRETSTTAAVNMRIAPSWLRIGNFELHSMRGEWESVRVLGEYVAREMYGWTDVVKGGETWADAEARAGCEGEPRPPWAARLVKEVAKRNAKTFALWQTYGFMHGVLNTDNISLMGDTIDYGPYAFMDAINEDEICNHSDMMGRYSFKMQPTMLVYAIDRLMDALAPVLGFEHVHGRAPRPGELLASTKEERQMWADQAEEVLYDDVRMLVQTTLLDAWATAWTTRLGIASQRRIGVGRIKSEIVDPFFKAFYGLDMTRSLRMLCDFPGRTNDIEVFAASLVQDAAAGVPDCASQADVAAWLHQFKTWLDAEARPASEITNAMKRVNPRFVLRNWITDDVAERLESNAPDTAFLERVRTMCANPFESYAHEEDAELCTVGRLLRTNTPSCSS